MEGIERIRGTIVHIYPDRREIDEDGLTDVELWRLYRVRDAADGETLDIAIDAKKDFEVGHVIEGIFKEWKYCGIEPGREIKALTAGVLVGVRLIDASAVCEDQPAPVKDAPLRRPRLMTVDGTLA
jgi:hypothetical protein